MKNFVWSALIAGACIAWLVYRAIPYRKQGVSPPGAMLSELDARAAPYFDAAHQRVSEVVDAICEHPVRLCAQMTKDNITGSHATADLLDPILQPVVEECRKGAAVYGVDADAGVFRQNVEAVNKVNGIAQVQTLGNLALEVAFLKPALTAVEKTLGSASTKMATTWGSGAACAASDGPSPVMDAVGIALALGGTAWGAYDVWQSRKELPAALTETLNRMIDDTRDACRKGAIP